VSDRTAKQRTHNATMQGRARLHELRCRPCGDRCQSRGVRYAEIRMKPLYVGLTLVLLGMAANTAAHGIGLTPTWNRVLADEWCSTA